MPPMAMRRRTASKVPNLVRRVERAVAGCQEPIRRKVLRQHQEVHRQVGHGADGEGKEEIIVEKGFASMENSREIGKYEQKNLTRLCATICTAEEKSGTQVGNIR